MAYQESFNQDDENNKNTQQGTTSSEQILSADNTGGQTPGAPGSPASAGQPTKSGSWTNLTSYINANQDKAAGMAGNVAQTLQNQSNTANQAAQEYSTSLNKQVQDNTVKDNGIVAGINNNPTKVTSEQYQAATRNYGGPTSATGTQQYADINKQFESTAKKVEDLGTAQGRYQSAADTFTDKTRGYTRGENTLDSFLLGAGAGGQALSDYQNQFKQQNAKSAWDNLISGLQSNIDTAKQTSAKTKADTQAALTSKMSSARSAIEQNLANNEALTTAVNSADPNIRKAAYSKMGLTPEQGELLYNSGTKMELSPGDVVNKDALAAYNALASLSGGTPLSFDSSGVNYAQLAENIKGKQQYEKDMAGIQKAIAKQASVTPTAPKTNPFAGLKSAMAAALAQPATPPTSSSPVGTIYSTKDGETSLEDRLKQLAPTSVYSTSKFNQ